MNETNIEADWRFVDAKNFAQFEIRDAKVLIDLWMSVAAVARMC